MLIHLDCQEKIYSNKNESSTLGLLNGLCKKDTADKFIHVSKYFGVGTATIVFVISAIFLKKNI